MTKTSFQDVLLWRGAKKWGGSQKVIWSPKKFLWVCFCVVFRMGDNGVHLCGRSSKESSRKKKESSRVKELIQERRKQMQEVSPWGSWRGRIQVKGLKFDGGQGNGASIRLTELMVWKWRDSLWLILFFSFKYKARSPAHVGMQM